MTNQSEAPNLSSTESDFRKVANIAPVMIWQSDSIGNCIWFNSTWLEFRGRRLEEEKGEGWLSGIYSEDLTRFLYVYRNSYKEKKPFETVFRIKRFDNENRWLRVRGIPNVENNELLGYVASCFDITDSKVAHDKLQQSELRLRKLLDEALVGFVETDLQSMIRYANPSFCKMLGFPQVMAFGKNLMELIHPEDNEKIAQIHKSLIDGKLKFVETDVRYLHKNNDIVHTMLKLTPLRKDSGIVIGFNAQVVDVSRRVELDTRIANSNARFELALKSRKMGVWEWEITNDRLVWDSTLYSLYGIKDITQVITFESWESLLHPKDRHLLQQELNDALQIGDAKIYEFRIILEDQSIRHIRTNAIVERDGDGNALRIVGLSWDITAGVQKERELEKQRALNSYSNRLLAFADMAKVISNEIEKPMKMIQSRLTELNSIVKENLKGNLEAESLSQKLFDDLKSIHFVVQSFVVLGEGQIQDQQVLTSIAGIIQESINLSQAPLKEFDIKIFTNAHEYTNLQIDCNPRQLTHIFLNLISNSTETIKVLETRWINIDIKLTQTKIEIRFVDSGSVIPNIDKGLGLRVIKNLLEDHGGHIYFDASSLNTTFVIELPNKAAESAA